MPLDQLPVPDVTLQDSDKATTFKTKINALSAGLKAAIQAFNVQIAAGNLAEDSAVIAGQHKDSAALSATTAGQHKDSAAQSAVTAGQHKDSAAQSAVTAGQHKDTAAQSMTTAGQHRAAAENAKLLADQSAAVAAQYPDGQLAAHFSLLDLIHRKVFLDFDFANNKYKLTNQFGLIEVPIADAITTVRASEATVTTPFGIATVGAHVPRITSHPTTGERLGLLGEAPAINLILNSQYTAANAETRPSNWSIGQNSGITATEASKRFLGALKLTQSGVDQRETHFQSVIVSSGTTYTLSTYIEFASPTAGVILSVVGTGGTVLSGVTSFNANMFTGPGTYSITFTVVSGTTVNVAIGLGCTNTATGSVVHETPQLEVGSTFSSYVPTGESQQSRPGENFSRNWQNISAFTLFFDFSDNGANDFVVVGGVGIDFENCIYLAGTAWNFRHQGVGVSLAAGLVSGRNLVAVRVKAGDYATFRNGQKLQASASSQAVAMNMTRMKLLSSPWESASSAANIAHKCTMSRCIVAPALSDAECIALTKV